MRCAKARERAFQLECFVHGLAHEVLDDVFAPGPERAASESAAEAFYARKADALHLARVSVEHCDAGVGEDLPNLVGLPGFVVMIPEYRDTRNAKRRGDVAREHARLFRQAVVGQIATEHEDIRSLGDLAK